MLSKSKCKTVWPSNHHSHLERLRRKWYIFLPNSLRKRTAVIVALATDAGLGTLKNRRLDNSPGIHSLDKEVVDKITNFYLTTSWICPGECCDCEKTKIQKQYLLTTLKEAHAMRHETHNVALRILHI